LQCEALLMQNKALLVVMGSFVASTLLIWSENRTWHFFPLPMFHFPRAFRVGFLLSTIAMLTACDSMVFFALQYNVVVWRFGQMI